MCLFPEENQQPVWGGNRSSEDKWQFSLDVKQKHTDYRRKSTKQKFAKVSRSNNNYSFRLIKPFNNNNYYPTTTTPPPPQQHTTRHTTTHNNTTTTTTTTPSFTRNYFYELYLAVTSRRCSCVQKTEASGRISGFCT